MANNRTAIRAAIKDLLLDQTSAEANVYTNRETSLWESELPAILIYTSQEPATLEALSSRRYIRTLELQVTLKVEATETVDDTLDAFVSEVETILNANPALSGTVSSAIQTNTEITVNSEGEKEVGVATLTFECKYIS